MREVHYFQLGWSCLRPKDLHVKTVLAHGRLHHSAHAALQRALVSRVEAGEFGPVNLIQENLAKQGKSLTWRTPFNLKLAGGAQRDIASGRPIQLCLFLKSQPHDALP